MIEGDQMATHELHSSPDTCHWGYFDSKLPPQLRIKSGDIATIQRGYVDPPAVKVRHQGREVIALGISMAKGGDIIRQKATIFRDKNIVEQHPFLINSAAARRH